VSPALVPVSRSAPAVPERVRGDCAGVGVVGATGAATSNDTAAVLSAGSDSRSDDAVAVIACGPAASARTSNLTGVSAPFGM
jgi:hypothetical protein